MFMGAQCRGHKEGNINNYCSEFTHQNSQFYKIYSAHLWHTPCF